jgi:hypothetical protein
MWRQRKPEWNVRPGTNESIDEDQSFLLDETLCLSVPVFLQLQDDFLVTPPLKNQSRRRNVKDHIHEISALPQAPFSMEIVMENTQHSLSLTAEDDSLSAILVCSQAEPGVPSKPSRKDEPSPDHTSFRGVEDEMNALHHLLQNADLGDTALSTSLHGSVTSLRLEDIMEIKQCLASQRKLNA